MISIKFFKARKYACKYLVEGIFLTLLWGCLSCANPDQQTDTEFSRKIEETKTDIQDLKTQTASVAPVSHELHAYYEESIGIIERCLGYVQLDIKKGETVAARIGLSEAGFLTSFLKEELDLAANQATAVYREIDVTQHGLRGDGVTNNKDQLENLLVSLKNNNGQVKLLFPEGNYYIKGKPGGDALSIVDIENIVFQGVGDATLLFDGHIISRNIMLVENCNNLEFRNLSIDIDPLICTLGKIVSVESGNQIIIEIREDYPIPDSSYWRASILRGLVRDPETEILIRELGDPRVIKLEVLGNRKYQLTLDDNALTDNQNMTGGFSAGQLFSLHPRARPGAGSTLSINNGRHLLFSHFNIYAGDEHLVVVRSSAGVKFLDCDITPKKGRAIMNNADGFHCPSNQKGIYLERCRVMGMNDDCMNFYSKLTSVLIADGDSKFTLLTSGNSDPDLCSSFCVGDNIAFLNANTGAFDGITTIKSITAIEQVEEDSRNREVRQNQIGGRQRGFLQIETTDPVPDILGRRNVGRPDRMASREYTGSGGDNYRRAMALKVPFEHMVMNLNAKNDGFIIRNCEFGYNRATGFKCKATNGVIRNTIFHDQIVLFQAELSWLEGIYPSKIEATDVTVNKGIRYHATLPGKNLSAEEVVRFMRYINYKNVVDGSGNDIPAPDDIQ